MISELTDHIPLESIGTARHESVRFCFLCLVGLVIGFVLFKLLTDASARRPQFQALGTYRPRTALIVALVPLAILLPLAYHECWSAFRELRADDASLTLVRHFPEREVSLSRGELERVRSFRDRGGYRLVIRGHDAVHESALTDREQVERLEQQLRAWSRSR
ncbi:MAG: hypothetical protein RL885_05765 [Planctomycetota bacterium]